MPIGLNVVKGAEASTEASTVFIIVLGSWWITRLTALIHPTWLIHPMPMSRVHTESR